MYNHRYLQYSKLTDQYFTPDSEKKKYKYRIIDGICVHMPEILKEWSLDNSDHGIYGEDFYLYLSKEESQFFEKIICKYKLEPIKEILLSYLVQLIIDYCFEDIEKLHKEILGPQRVELKKLIELNEHVIKDNIHIKNFRLHWVDENKSKMYLTIENPELIDSILKTISNYTESPSTHERIQIQEGIKIGSTDNGRFQSQRKKRQHGYSIELVKFFKYLGKYSKDYLGKQIDLNDRQIHIIIGKILHMSKLSDIRGELFQVNDEQYYDYIRIKLKKDS